MKRVFLLLTLFSLAGAAARADDQTQAVQQALKDQGFYYGAVDGQGGQETAAAIRRYQIRQGLDVTGNLDAKTLASLNLGAGDNQTQSPKTVVQSDQDFLRKQPPAATPAPATGDEAPPQPPPDAGQALPADYARFFRKTPYETAPPVVQRSTVQRAQQRLARDGFYRGVADGQPGDALSRALVAYQRDAELPPTGRLDMETLSDMNLLPQRHVVIHPYAQPQEDRAVYRGIWVR